MTSSVIESFKFRIAEQLAHYLPSDAKSTIDQAMHYAVTNGGKRLRPLLVYLTGLAAGAPLISLDRPAVAVEIIHAYSLVHDDLPAMDNDDLRRGLPTCHKVYGEALAILAGDAMQALAFEVLADPMQVNAVTLIALLAKACGAVGMAGGQALDLAAVGQSLNKAELDRVHALKTGTLMSASMLMGLHCGTCSTAMADQVKVIADLFGLIYQIQDDIFDVEMTTDERGKQQGGDARLAKPTYPVILSLVGAKAVLRQLCEELAVLLAKLPPRAEHLVNYLTFMVNRSV